MIHEGSTGRAAHKGVTLLIVAFLFGVSTGICGSTSVLAGGPPTESKQTERSSVASDTVRQMFIQMLTATADQPAWIALAGDDLQVRHGRAALSVVLRPVRVIDAEPYLVDVYIQPLDHGMPDGPGEQLDTIAFFPPPEEGQTRDFVLTIPERLAESPLALAFRLVPAHPDIALQKSELRVETVRPFEG